ncbi:hypothetical protein PAPYR_506 [Paratrimastix pyriformis]|uniref:Uncharacterized protein n=1 Tax=Paratrimastix pyriformis TaxID=342808 RepID=A0ABQ8UTS6_9EUKA|nr:hypothetical protein PAPYR_506 [Paratrimastix pyriformis]
MNKCLRIESASHQMMESPVTPVDLFALLPPDLLPCIVERSNRPLQTYMQLLGLSRAIRQAVRGFPREMSFDETFGYEPLIPPADAVAALIGPCKGLTKLKFRSVGAPYCSTYGCGRTEAACAGWVDEAFGGHDRLAVLEYLPTFEEPVIARILLRLPGLLELHFGHVDLSWGLAEIVARSCPHLESLRGDSINDDLYIPNLAPLAGSLRCLKSPQYLFSPQGVETMSRLTALGTVYLTCFEATALMPIAAHLTRLNVALNEDEWDDAMLPGPWLSHLERFKLREDSIRFTPRLAGFLAANRATLQRLRLWLKELDAAGLAALVATLNDLPRLTHLQLLTDTLPAEVDINTALIPGLPSGLEHLNLSFCCEGEPTPPLYITSHQLKCLHLHGIMHALGEVSLDCPALVELRLPTVVDALTLKCPRLRELHDPPVWFDCFSVPMPDLETVVAWVHDPVWWPHLLTLSPHLRRLSLVGVRPCLLPMLCAGTALVDLSLSLARFLQPLPNPLVLRLPGRLETLLLLDLGNGSSPLDLTVEAPGLRRMQIITRSSDFECRLRCPCLASFICADLTDASLTNKASRCQITALELDDRARLRRLAIEGHCKTNTLLDLLEQHQGLRHVLLYAPEAASDWPRLAAALGGLPRLANLQLNIRNAPSPISLACPQLRILRLDGADGDQKVVLTSPLLELIWDGRSHVELAVPAPHLWQPKWS